MKPWERPRPKTSFEHVRVDGQVLAHIHRTSGKPVKGPPTACIGDYPPATEAAVGYNEDILRGDGPCKTLKTKPFWREEQGVMVFCKDEFMLKCDSTARVLDEFWERFNDSTFSLKGNSQYCHGKELKGGWLIPYANTLAKDEGEQARSVLVVPRAEFTSFRKICPETARVVDSVQRAVCRLVPEYNGRLVATEYTYLLGYSKTSCTSWHTDTAEHPRDGLVLTSVTLLSAGNSSMCIAGKTETWYIEPFDTVIFDPNLEHRSGVTYPHVAKLSIHWKLRSGSGAGAPGSSTDAAIDVDEDGDAENDKEEGGKGEEEDNSEGAQEDQVEEGEQPSGSSQSPGSEPQNDKGKMKKKRAIDAEKKGGKGEVARPIKVKLEKP